MTKRNIHPAKTATYLLAKAIVELENAIVAREAARHNPDWDRHEPFEYFSAAVTRAEEKVAAATGSLAMVSFATGRAAVDLRFRELLNAE